MVELGDEKQGYKGGLLHLSKILAGRETMRILSQNLWGVRRHHPEACRGLAAAHPHQSLNSDAFSCSGPRSCGVVGELSHLLTHVASKGHLAQHFRIHSCARKEEGGKRGRQSTAPTLIDSQGTPTKSCAYLHSYRLATNFNGVSSLSSRLSTTTAWPMIGGTVPVSSRPPL